jgi:hypothetical protein
MTGRPTTFTPELGDDICFRLAEGMTLRKIAEMDGMPAVSTILLWVVKGFREDEAYKAFSEQYALAREAQSEMFMDEVVEIADDDSEDYHELGDGDGPRVAVNHEHISRSKIRIETRLKVTEKFAAKRYGPRADTSVNVNVNGLPLPEQDKAMLDEYAKGK